MLSLPVPARPGAREFLAVLSLIALLVSLFLCGCFLSGCYMVRPSKGGGNASAGPARGIDPGDIALPAGYRIEAVATGLTFPTAVVFDDNGALYAVEGGYAYGEEWGQPRLLKVMRKNMFTPIAVGDSNGPWTGITYAAAPEAGPGKGSFYVAEGGQLRGGRILRIGMDGKSEALVENLPSLGDHHTNGPVLGPDGMLYFGQGTATNSGVVGRDNHEFGWLARHRTFHDTPCQDIALSGVNYSSKDPFGGKKSKDTIETGAYSPFGTTTAPGQIVKGEIPCNGAIMRIARQGGRPELVAWGFRNPFAMAIAADGRLFALDNGYDDRGSRPVWGAGDLLWEVQPGRWYGWPDYSGNKSLDHAEFTKPHGERPQRLLDKDPGPWLATQAAVGNTPPAVTAQDGPPKPIAVLPVHSSADGLDFSRSEGFGYRGHAFVAEFGDMAPSVGKVLEPVGFKVVRVDMARGVSEDFAVNRKGPGPASRLETGGLERPVSLRFGPDGNSLYVVDFGVMTVSGKGDKPRKQTGVIWRIWKEGK
ncbi:MAG: glucose dehydrogenase [Fibrobacteres bacterium]|nr:glucose dehydrogenase [Fibrobacterota bacterium]